MILLSVIIPIYNAEPWLEQCISSLLDSVAGASSLVEYILINDGSTDNSGVICDRYASVFSNFHVVHKQNGGIASARNAGIAIASGQYYAWVDPDDTVSPDWFSSIADTIQTHAPDILVMDMLRFGLGTDQPEVYGRPGGWIDPELFYTDILRDIRMRSGLPNKVMRSGLFSGVQFDTLLTILEDFDVMPQILRSAQKIFYIPRCLYHYRQHEKSLLHHFSPDLAFHSVEIALRRMAKTEKKYRRAAAMAVSFLFAGRCGMGKRVCGSRAKPGLPQDPTQKYPGPAVRQGAVPFRKRQAPPACAAGVSYADAHSPKIP